MSAHREPWLHALREWAEREDRPNPVMVDLRTEQLLALLDIAEGACDHVEQRRRATGPSEWPRLLDAVAALKYQAGNSHSQEPSS